MLMPSLRRLALLTVVSLSACETVDCTPVVTPAVANVLTCSTQQLTATMPASCKPGVSWSASGGGTVDAQGLYSAPTSVPDPATVTLTADSTANPMLRGTSLLTLSTALPQASVMIGSTADDTFFQQQVVSSGERGYAVLLQRNGSSWQLQVTRSDDGGRTWSTPVKASDAPSMIEMEAPTIAIDPVDPQTIYVSYLLNAATSTTIAAAQNDGSGKTVALAVSTNGGVSFTNYALASAVSGFGEWPTVAAPRAGTVLVEVPAAYPAGLRFFVDDAKGAGFSATTLTGTNLVANEYLDVTPGHAGFDFNFILMNGGSYGSESPRLVSDGTGKVCAIYVAGFDATNADGQTRVVAQCSSDGGHTFGQAIDVEVDSARSASHHPVGAFGPQGQLVVTWWTVDPQDSTHMVIKLATSRDGGATFGTPRTLRTWISSDNSIRSKPVYPALAWDGDVLWISYLVGGIRIVDKSCDGGENWSGPQALDPEGVSLDHQWPGLVRLSGKMTLVNREGSNGTKPYQATRLVP